MSGLLNFYRAFLNLPLSLLVKSRSIPTHPVAELELNLEQPIVYVLPYTSQTDLLILQKNCLALNLPDPLQENVIEGQTLLRFVFLDEGRRFFKSKGAKSETESIFYRYLDLHRANAELDVQLVPVSVLWGGLRAKKMPAIYRCLPHSNVFYPWFGLGVIILYVSPCSIVTLYGN